MSVLEIYGGNDRRSMIKRYERKSKADAVRELVDLMHCNWRQVEILERERDAALAELAALKGGREAGKLQWPEIVGLVNEVLGFEAHKFPRDRGSIGHEMTGINFNSLARIIDRVQHRYTATPAQASALALEELLTRCADWCDRQPKQPLYGRTAGDMVRTFMACQPLAAAAPTPGASDGKGGDHSAHDLNMVQVPKDLHLITLGMLSSYVTTLAGIDFPDNDEGDYQQRLNENKRVAVNSTIAKLRALIVSAALAEVKQ